MRGVVPTTDSLGPGGAPIRLDMDALPTMRRTDRGRRGEAGRSDGEAGRDRGEAPPPPPAAADPRRGAAEIGPPARGGARRPRDGLPPFARGAPEPRRREQPPPALGGARRAVEDAYELGPVLGEGASAVVLAGRCRSTQARRAVKIVRGDAGLAHTVYREVRVLGLLGRCAYVPRLIEVCARRDGGGGGAAALALVFDHGGRALHQLAGAGRPPLPEGAAKLVMHDLLSALRELHRIGVMHRDVKPENLLVLNGRVRLCDFNMARLGAEESSYTPGVVTPWYRCPELLLNLPYSCAVDVWSAGCVLAELLLGEVLLRGNSEAEQLALIFGTLGFEQDVRDLSRLCGPTAPLPSSSRVPGIARLEERFKELFSKRLLHGSAVQLMRGLLAVSPTRRLTAAEALEHPFFADFGGNVDSLRENLRGMESRV